MITENLSIVIDFYKICLYLRNLKINVYSNDNHCIIKESQFVNGPRLILYGSDSFSLIKNERLLFKFYIRERDYISLPPSISIDFIEEILGSYDRRNLDITNLVLCYGRDILKIIFPDKEIVDDMEEMLDLFHSDNMVLDLGYLEQPLYQIKLNYPFQSNYGDNV